MKAQFIAALNEYASLHEAGSMRALLDATVMLVHEDLPLSPSQLRLLIAALEWRHGC